MGYCDNQWISDYNYVAWYDRGANVNLPRIYEPETPTVSYQVIIVDGEGGASIETSAYHRSHSLGGRNVPLSVSSIDGRTFDLTGSYFTFDHLPGGFLFVPRQDFEVNTAEFVVEDIPTFAARTMLPR